MLQSSKICILVVAALAVAGGAIAQQASTNLLEKAKPYQWQEAKPYQWLSDPNFAQALTVMDSRPFISASNLRYNRSSSFSDVYNLGVGISDRHIISPNFYPFSNVILSAPTSAYSRRVASRVRPGRWSWAQWSTKPDLPGATASGIVSQPFVDRQLLYSLPSGRRSAR